ncbi:hypothetical protein CN894_11775 [Bacillus thuringiensis]|uniref:phosphocholine cytidylyltransferase family protein n=1 Tax=Bacillus thuringiensis TaxID=1428 RepID=UPI000BFC04CB|nr:phosphocholine cytidylyltransferase family protein [Bacillus thuringiensis]PGH72158.1 hypothetical protein CN894_11775 [Bacillus thuringiensis]
MRVIIPAAGVGSRLLPLTKLYPKGLVQVGGKPLLMHTMELLYKAGVSEVICVSGYQADFLEQVVESWDKRPSVHFVRNEYYQSTNSIFSLSLTRPWWDEDFIVIDSDVYIKSSLLRCLMNQPGNCLAIDNTKTSDEIDMKVQLRDGLIWHMDKEMPRSLISGEFFGLSRWTVNGSNYLSQMIDRLLEAGHTNVWYEFAIRDAAKNMPILPVFTDSSQWLEIDTTNDLEKAELSFAKNQK